MHLKFYSVLATIAVEYLKLWLFKKTISSNAMAAHTVKHTRKSAAVILKRLSVSIKVENSLKGNGLFICNHLSYLDPLIILSRVPGVFVTSTEVKKQPIVGKICQLCECVFINRKGVSSLSKDMKQIRKMLEQGINVIVFPEATSSNGDNVLPFKPSVFQLAWELDVPIYPICLKYTELNGKPLNKFSKSIIHYYGDHEFVSHLRKLSWQKSIQVKLIFLEPLINSHYLNRKEMAKISRELVLREYETV